MGICSTCAWDIEVLEDRVRIHPRCKERWLKREDKNVLSCWIPEGSIDVDEYEEKCSEEGTQEETE